MPLNPGNLTVTFVIRTWNATPDRLGVTGPVDTPHSVGGCTMQPVSGRDHITDTMYSEATWKCMAPVNSTTESVKADDMVQFNGEDYRVLFVKGYYDTWGNLRHFTFMCRKETG